MTVVADEQLAEKLATQAQPREDARSIARSPDVKKASSAVMAGALHQTAQLTGDPGFDEEAAAHLAAAEGVGVPEAITPEMAAELGLEIGAPSGAPPALTAPQVVIGPDGQRYIEVPDDVAARMGLPVASFEEEEAGAQPYVPEPTAVEQPVAAAPAGPALELSLPPDIAAELEPEPDDLDDLSDFDDSALPVPSTAEGEPSPDGGGSPGSNDAELAELEERAQYDPLVAKLLADKRALERRNEHVEKEQLKHARRSWLDQDAQHFTAVPGDAAKDIARRSKSRREFLAGMKAEHQRLAPMVARATAAATEQLEAERRQIAEERRRMQAAGWGTAVTAGAPAVQETNSVVPSELREQELRVAEARGGLRGRMSKLVQTGHIRL